ncbi:hypothetical protein [Nocardioides sp. URHA0020]|uniref:hypothetical protein n=1 Tax=Nocardioides sp. URHA0020 TaxID=1380392 RepID=UPI00048BBD9D|nr:hypothetical protein [Nocardioides sp. URHA0020]
MTLVDSDAAVAAALQALGVRRGAVVYVDRAVREAGVVALGAESHRVTGPSLLVFRDEMPGANWMHPCTYALVDLDSGELLRTVPSDRPPAFGRLPDTWVVAADPDGIADLAPHQPT